MIPVVHWAQSASSVFLKMECKPSSNTGAAQFVDLKVDISSKHLTIYYRVEGEKSPYELSQDFAYEVAPEESKHVVSGRTLRVELHKKEKRAKGWFRPFKNCKKAKWLKTDFNRWNDDLEIEAEGGEDAEREEKPDLRAALLEVERKEREEREARQKELEESLKKGEKPKPREEIEEFDMDTPD
jgi:hypothetical protein